MLRISVSVRDGGAASALRAAAEQLPRDLDALTSRAADRTLEALRAAAPVGRQVPGGRPPGGLRQSIRFDLEGTTAAFEASQVAEYVIGGTEAHTIQGRDGRPLHFFWEAKGDWVTLMRVRHPGTRANDFRVPALDEAAGQAEVLLGEVADQLAGRLAE